MDFIVSSKTHPTFSESEKSDYSGDREDPETQNPITSRLYLKPSHASETLDKDDVLRRIRHHKRVNKVQNALHALLSSPFSGGADNAPLREQRWLDDAFSAP